MSRPFRDRVRDPLTWLEQLAHLVLGASAVVVAALSVRRLRSWWPVVLGASTAMVWVIVREFIDGLPVESWGDTLLDSAFTLAGGLVAGFVARAFLRRFSA